MILPMYTEQERKELNQKYLRLFKWIENYQSGAIIADKKQYEAKYEECSSLYEIIHDL
tara:strand:+ start:9527 stop:9700 length:174 start_codon:yes stop_codon:yes gene_type:complete